MKHLLNKEYTTAVCGEVEKEGTASKPQSHCYLGHCRDRTVMIS